MKRPHFMRVWHETEGFANVLLMNKTGRQLVGNMSSKRRYE